MQELTEQCEVSGLAARRMPGFTGPPGAVPVVDCGLFSCGRSCRVMAAAAGPGPAGGRSRG